MGKVGRKTDLTKELLAEIKASVFKGKNLKEIAEHSEMSVSTLYTWHSDNYLNLKDKIEGWRRDYKLELADKNIEKILQLNVDDKDFVRTVSDMSKFVKETLDKDNYSKRTDITTKGKELPTPILGYDISKNNSDPEDNQSGQES